jgi:hypothetical protein
MSFPFSPYDFFGYLVAGFLVICSTEYAVDSDWILNRELKVPQAAFWLGAAYIIGHIVANVSSYFIEHKFLRGVLRSPEELLFEDEPARTAPVKLTWRERLGSPHWWLSLVNPVAWWRWFFPVGLARVVFPIFHKPFPQETRQRVLKKSSEEGFTKAGRALYLHCFATVKGDKTTYDRLTSFLNLYGFCRNVCMGSLIAFPILLFGACRDLKASDLHVTGQFQWGRFYWALAALGVAVGMLYRYLKFFRHYTMEVFTSYAELKKDDPKEEPKPV